MAEFNTITTEISDGIFTLTLNRPDRMNAFTGEMMKDMIAAFDLADADDSVRAVIVTGAGDRAFCAGADLGAGKDTFDYTKRAERLEEGSPLRADGSVDYTHPGVRDSGGKVTLRIFNSKKPVIGAINGAAVGIGATMQLPMDFRLASTKARFGFVFAKRGIVPEAASSWFLPRASSGSAKRSTGAIQAACSAQRKRSAAASSNLSTNLKTSSPPPAPSPTA